MHNLLQQTQHQLNGNIKRYGSNFRCLQAIVEQEAKHVLNAFEINSLYQLALNEGFIVAKCKVIDDNSIIEQTATYLGLKQVPLVQYTAKGYYLRICFGIGDKKKHYVLVNRCGAIFNPNLEIKTTKIESVRYFA